MLECSAYARRCLAGDSRDPDWNWFIGGGSILHFDGDRYIVSFDLRRDAGAASGSTAQTGGPLDGADRPTNARGEIVGIPHMVTGSGLALAVSSRTVAGFLAGPSVDSREVDLIWI